MAKEDIMAIDPTNNAAAIIPQPLIQNSRNDGDKDNSGIKGVLSAKPNNDGDKDDAAVVNISAQAVAAQSVAGAAVDKVPPPIAAQTSETIKARIDKIV